MRKLIATFAIAVAAATCLGGPVHMVTDEAESVLHILEIEAKGESVPESEWTKLFATDGYRRLKQREQGMGRKFEDDDFRKFVQSPEEIAQRGALVKTLNEWVKADVGECRRLALAYLPKGADITAKVYALIKPLHNSFVWQVDTDPAIMLYLDPGGSRAVFVNTVAHEMHHIGYGRSCPSKEFSSWLDRQPKAKQTAFLWLGAFGEGYAVLAAAGGLSENPRRWGNEDANKAFDEGMAHQPEQFKQVEDFFMQVLDGRLDPGKAQTKAMDFYGIVGPWYTVGYTVATTIEKAYGRDRLIGCYRDPRLLLRTYNDAVGKLGSSSPVWSQEFISAMK